MLTGTQFWKQRLHHVRLIPPQLPGRKHEATRATVAQHEREVLGLRHLGRNHCEREPHLGRGQLRHDVLDAVVGQPQRQHIARAEAERACAAARTPCVVVAP